MLRSYCVLALLWHCGTVAHLTRVQAQQAPLTTTGGKQQRHRHSASVIIGGLLPPVPRAVSSDLSLASNKRLCPRWQKTCRSYPFVFHCQLFLASTRCLAQQQQQKRADVLPPLALLSSVHVGLRLFTHNFCRTTSGIHAACSNRARLGRVGCGSANAGIWPAGSCAAGSPAEHQAVRRNLKGAAARNAVALDGVAGAQGASLPPPCVLYCCTQRM